MLLAGLTSCGSDTKRFRLKKYPYNAYLPGYEMDKGITIISNLDNGYHAGDTIRKDYDYLTIVVDTAK